MQSSQFLGLSSVQLSPNRVCEDHSCEIVDVFPVYQASSDTTGYLPAMSPVAPLVPGNLPQVRGSLPTSPVRPGPDSLPLGITWSFDSLVGCQSLIEQDHVCFASVGSAPGQSNPVTLPRPAFTTSWVVDSGA